MWRSAGAAVLLALLAACHRAGPAAAGDPTSPGSLSRLVGADEATVAASLGAPDRSFPSNGLRYLVYERPDVWRAPRPQNTVSFPCRITLILDQGHVRSFDRQGAGCD